ncbi:MAG: hypothetical protein HY811_06385 [Planctomycetes bacterium]|nr:hypothetical protein [Planctomycetota bacterium]
MNKLCGKIMLFVLVALLASCAGVSKEDWPIKPDTGNPLSDEEALKLVPDEYREKVQRAFQVAGDNKPQLITAIKSVPGKYSPALGFLVSQTGYRYFFPSMDKAIPDASNITADLLLTNVKLGYQARQTFPWAGDLDEDTFRRFVLTYRATTEQLVDWRSYFWNHAELRAIVDEFAKRINGKDHKAADQSFKEMLYKINTEWVGKNVPYAPRGMPDMNPIEAIKAKTGRCTDQTNTLIAILRTYGIAATGVRAVWWPEVNDNHTWAAVYDPFTKEWLDIDSGQGGSPTDPEYFRRFIHHKEKKAAKIYWVYPGEEGGETFRNLSLKGDEVYPPSIEKYLIAKPMVDKTERYNDVIDMKCSHNPHNTMIWLAIYNSGEWRPVAGARSDNEGMVVFPKVGCNIRYRLMVWTKANVALVLKVLIPKPDGTIEEASDPQEKRALLAQKAVQLLEAKKFKEAKEVFLEILKDNPNDVNSLYNMACACSLRGDKQEALDYLEKSIKAGWDDFAHLKKDSDLDNIREEPRYKKILKASGAFLDYPSERIKIDYAILVSKATKDDVNWINVVTAFTDKYNAKVFVYEGNDPTSLMKELIQYTPKYVAFIAQPTEVSREFIFHAKQMMRDLDEDPYEDAIWGIITGYNYEDCLRMAKADNLNITKALSGIGGGWLDYFNEGLAFSEGEKNAMTVKVPGKPVEKQKGPDDTTKSFVDILNTNQYQMMSTSGHATEHDWQIGYSYPNGMILSKGGKLFGYDLAKQIYPISTTNSKIYFSPGNCYIGHIADMDCMALAWIHNGTNQFFGHTLPQGQPCYAWNIVNYFMALQGQFTYAESVYLHQVAADFTKAPTVCCHSTVFYGDPAWEVRIAKEIEPPYTQTLKFDKKNNKITITIEVEFRQDYGGPPVGCLLPEFIKKPEVKSATEGLKLLPLDNVVIIDAGKRKEGDKIQAVVSAEFLPLKK